MIKKILVAVDLSECGSAALDRARALARTTGAELVLVYANELPVLPVGEPPFVPAYVLEERVQRSRERFTQLVVEVQRDVNARGYTDVGPAHEVVSAAIAKEHPDLVIAGTHGRRGLSRLLLGSFTERLVRTCPVPVLTVRSVLLEPSNEESATC
jgi:nucleotide-binding universal stress UspA family protein